MSVVEIEDGVYESTAVIDNGSFGTRTIRFETGRLAQQAAGSVVGQGQGFGQGLLGHAALLPCGKGGRKRGGFRPKSRDPETPRRVRS